MSPDELTIIEFDDKHLSKSFDCDDEPLNKFLLDKAKTKHSIMESFVYLALLGNELVGYVALATGNVVDTSKANRCVPAVLVGRLAVDKNYQRRGIGKKLVLWSIRKAQIVSKHVACRYVYADVLEGSEALGFYKDHLKFRTMDGSLKDSIEYPGKSLIVVYVDMAASRGKKQTESELAEEESS